MSDESAGGGRPLLWLVCFCVLLCSTPAAGDETEPAPVTITITSPLPGEVVTNKVTMAPIKGTAQSGSGEVVEFDVMLALDVSYSTRYPSGIDVDQDGEIGFNPKQELVAPGTYPEHVVCSDPHDTILAAQVHASMELLDVLDPERTQVGVIVFSGLSDPKTGERLSPSQNDALVKVPLTRDMDRVRKALEQILAEGPYGATNMAAAIKLAVVELAGLPRAYSEPRPGARKVVLFMTDGVPTFPYGKASTADPEDTEAALAAARLARRAGITINGFAIGQQALASPLAVREISNITLGRFTPVRDPGDIASVLQGISFASIDDVVITNRSTGEVSYDVRLSPDGSFYGFVPVRIGQNEVEIAALASDGGEASKLIELEFEEAKLSPRELAIELERIKKRNQALMRLIEKRRIEEFRERQRRRVEIEAEDEEGGEATR